MGINGILYLKARKDYKRRKLFVKYEQRRICSLSTLLNNEFTPYR